MNMEANFTFNFTEEMTMTNEAEDPRTLATSYLMYKVGKYKIHTPCTVELLIPETEFKFKQKVTQSIKSDFLISELIVAWVYLSSWNWS